MFLLAVGVWLQAHAGIYAGLQARMSGPQQGVASTDPQTSAPAPSPAHISSDTSSGDVRAGPPPMPATVAAKQFGLTVTTSPETVTVGQHFTVTVRVLVPAALASAIQFPTGSDTSQDVTSSFGSVQRHEATHGDVVEATATYQLAAWDLGGVGLGLADLVIGKTHIDLSTPSFVFVRSVLPKGATARLDARPKEPRPTFSLTIIARRVVRRVVQDRRFTFVIIALIVAGLLWIVWARLRRRSETQTRIYWTQWAKSEFKRIESLHLLDKGEPERHAILMTTTLRQFLINQFPTVRASATTRELAAALRQESVIPADRTLQLFERVDMLKFAGVNSEVTEARTIGLEDETVVDEVEARRQAAEIAAREAQQAAAAKKTVKKTVKRAT